MSRAAYDSNPLSPQERVEQVDRLLAQLVGNEEALTDWERGFVMSIRGKVGYAPVTDRQLYFISYETS